jgi:hypothetical protein
MNAQKTPWDLDIRVRERNLRKGVLAEKDVEKMLKELSDVGANAETVSTPQPALVSDAGRHGEAEVQAVAAPAGGSSSEGPGTGPTEGGQG